MIQRPLHPLRLRLSLALAGFAHDVRIGVRSLGRTPAFTAGLVLVLALAVLTHRNLNE